MTRNLIIVPVGMPLNFNGIDPRSHYRYIHNNRNYDIIVIQYGDFVPESNTFDTIYKIIGNKFQILKKLYDIVDFAKYNYIGLYDDDIVVDFKTINESLY